MASERCVGFDPQQALSGVCRTATGCAAEAQPDAYCGAIVEGALCDLATGQCLSQAECEADVDCGLGMCEAGVCISRCVVDSDCAVGEVCQTPPDAPDSPDKTCQLVRDGVCEDDADCDADERCVGGVCARMQSAVYHYILLEDVSSGSAACDTTSQSGLRDAGADIFAVELLDDVGQIIGYGQTIDYQQGAGEADATDASIFDGEPRDIDQDECPAEQAGARFRIGSVVSLGCGGYLLLSLVGANGQPIDLEEGMDIFVGEYAPICNPGGGSSDGSDRYTVSVCLDTDSAANQSVSSCTRQLGVPRGGNGIFRVSGL